MPKVKKNKKSSAAMKGKKKQTEEEQPPPKPKEDTSGGEDNGQSDADMDEDADDVSNNKPSTDHMRRHKRKKLDSWAKKIIRGLVYRHGEEIQREVFHKPDPNLDILEKYLKEANAQIRTANLKNNVYQDQNTIPEGIYRIYFVLWVNLVQSDYIKDDPEKGWEAYYNLRKIIRLTNRDYYFPDI
jgi:hypothetical protein